MNNTRTFKTKAELQEAIKNSISTNDSAAVRALKRLFEYQTSDEQAAEVTSHHNGVGFTGSDAGILSSFVKQLQYRSLSDKQMGVLKKVIVKYAHQLMEQAIRKGLYKKIDGVWVIV